ncbi:MAG: hypothetical protein WBK28_02490 [Minisyncoccia bacterium]
MVRNVFLLLVSTLIFGVAVGYFFGYDFGFEEGLLSAERPVLSFEDCVLAGYPVMESYPEQCRTPEGMLFVRALPLPEESEDGEQPRSIGGEGSGVPDGPMPPEVLIPRQGPGSLACPMDAKLCPDGSAVGRTGPNCEFPACPGE